MLELPPVAPAVGLTHRIRLSRDYYVRIDSVDYSVDPRAIGRFVDVSASPDDVIVYCDAVEVGRHQRSWASHATITDPGHVAIAAGLRNALADHRHRQSLSHRRHPDGHPVALRALPDYDVLFGVDFDSAPTTVRNSS